MRRLARAAGIAALATAGATVLVPGIAQAGTATAQSLPTRIPNVHIRSTAHNGAGSKVLATVAAAGTPVEVSCYVSTGGKYWFKTTTPVGYVAARNLVYARPHGAKVPAGLTAC